MRAAKAPIAIAILLLPGIGFAGDAETRIAEAFAELGMAEEKSVCYGSVIGEKLDEEAGDEAASIVEAAETSSDVRQGVKQSNSEIVKAFLAASNRCGR